MAQFAFFAAKRIGAGIVAAGIVLWAVLYVINIFDSPRLDHSEHLDPFVKSQPVASGEDSRAVDAQVWDEPWPPEEASLPEGVSPEMVANADAFSQLDTTGGKDAHADVSGAPHTEYDAAVQTPELDTHTGAAQASVQDANTHVTALDHQMHAAKTQMNTTDHSTASDHAVSAEKAQGAATDHGTKPEALAGHDAHGKSPTEHGTHGPPPAVDLPRGVAFVDATIKPIEYELTERFYGWRANDIIEFTDNVNNYQIGVLEVTRRTTVNLTERISRTGATEAFNQNLQNAMNWLMVKADSYWFPSSEGKYKAALDELRKYKEKLFDGQGTFYNRADNIIPLLKSYENLLGSCEENLVKAKEKDGEKVSFFISDDYFYYAKGVASAMVTVLEAVSVDFGDTIDSRRGLEVLHHAIESCHHAVEIEPWIIFNSDPSSVWANHRANMAAPISHARFYLSVLIKALST